MKTRRRRTKGKILQTATVLIIGNREGDYYWGERIYCSLAHIWETAFTRGYDKALRDQAKKIPSMFQPSGQLTALLQEVNGVSDADAAADFEVVGNQVRRERAKS